MELEIKINNRVVKVKLLKREGNFVKAQINDNIYEIDIVKICENNYSIIHQGKSHVIDMAHISNTKKYTAATYFNNYDIEIIDAQAKAKALRKANNPEEETKIITSPMSGNIVKIAVSPEQEVKIGQLLLIVEAMKMQTEYRSAFNSRVKKITVQNGDTISAGQLLIELY